MNSITRVAIPVELVSYIKEHPEFGAKRLGWSSMTSFVVAALELKLGVEVTSSHERLSQERKGKPNPHHWSKGV